MADMDKIWKTMRKFWKDTSQVTELKGTVCSGKSRNVLDGNSTARWGKVAPVLHSNQMFGMRCF